MVHLADFRGYSRRQWELLRRMGRSRGFGVQSPTAYRFITEVVNNRLPYYSYEELAKRFPNLPRRRHRQCQLMFRLANYQQAESVFIRMPIADELHEYLFAGCKRMKLSSVAKGCRMAMLPAVTDALLLPDTMAEDGMIILTEIYNQGVETDCWQTIKTHERVKMTFDTYDCGVVLLGNGNKGNYCLNL